MADAGAFAIGVGRPLWTDSGVLESREEQPEGDESDRGQEATDKCVARGGPCLGSLRRHWDWNRKSGRLVSSIPARFREYWIRAVRLSFDHAQFRRRTALRTPATGMLFCRCRARNYPSTGG